MTQTHNEENAKVGGEIMKLNKQKQLAKNETKNGPRPWKQQQNGLNNSTYFRCE